MSAVDRNGKQLEAGQTVKVYQEDQTRVAAVVKVLEIPTVNCPGHWVDVDAGLGAEGMPSYLLEVVA